MGIFCLLLGSFLFSPILASAQVIIILDDGCASFYQQSQISINFSPNPADESLLLSSSEQLVIDEVVIEDLDKRIWVETDPRQASASIDVSSLPSGTYLLTVRTSCGMGTAQLMITH